MADLLAEIMAASDEQTRGVEQVDAAVSQMGRVTQQNAALVDQAGQLNASVGVFALADASV